MVDIEKEWLKGGTPDMRLPRQKARQSDAKANLTEWLDIWLDGRMVEINGKGQIRENKSK